MDRPSLRKRSRAAINFVKKKKKKKKVILGAMTTTTTTLRPVGIYLGILCAF